MQKTKTQSPRKRKIWDMPKKYEYLKELISETTWNIAQKLEEKETGAGIENRIIPRRITLEINIEPDMHDFPIVIKEKFEFGYAYNEQMKSIYSSGPTSMGLPSWYTSDPYLIVGRKVFDKMLHEIKGKTLTVAKRQLKKIGKSANHIALAGSNKIKSLS